MNKLKIGKKHMISRLILTFLAILTLGYWYAPILSSSIPCSKERVSPRRYFEEKKLLKFADFETDCSYVAVVDQTAISTTLSSNEKKQILKSIQLYYDTATTGDMPKIRTFLKDSAQTDEDRKFVLELGDNEIADGSGFYMEFKRPSDSLLTDPDVIWTVNGKTASVKIEPDFTIQVNKINRTWYIDTMAWFGE